MSERASNGSVDDLPHEAAVDDFADRVANADIEGLERLILFGSVAKTTHTLDSDVDVLAVVDTSVDVHTVEETLRDIAYDTMLDCGVVFSIHAVTTATFEQRADHPFFQIVSNEGTPIYG